MNPEMKSIAERLKRHNLSEVARRAGMSYNNLSRIVNGHKRDIYVSTANTLCRVMDELEAEK